MKNHIICFENMRLWTYCVRSHFDVIFHLRMFLRNMTSICLLSLTFRRNRSENVVEWLQTKVHFKKT